MRPYFAILTARFRMLLQYRAAALAGIGTQIFWGLIRVMIMEAFYRSSPIEQPMEIEDVVTYIWLGQALLAMIPWNLDREIREMVSRGTVAYEITRPLDLYSLWYSRAIAMRTAPVILRATPIFILGLLFLQMGQPDSVASGLAWMLATIGALMLGCAITTLLHISLFWTISGEGISRIVPAMVMIFSGMVIPLPLFPDWAQAVMQFLPFAGLIDTPFRLYIGHIPPSELPLILIHQVSWTITLVILGRMLMSKGVRNLVVQGG